MLKRITFLTLFLAMILMLPKISEAQIVRATGNSTEATSQLIFYYDQAGEDSLIQVTNTNDTEAVTIHVQIFRSFNVSDIPLVNTICDERDFVDVLTPNDTHVYDLANANFPVNEGETAADPGNDTSIDVTGTKGFVVITPVVSDVDFTAIAFEHMIGKSQDDDFEFVVNAMGRSAVDFATESVVADGTPLDGVTNGYVVLQPDELVFQFQHEGSSVDIVGIAFSDVYGPPGLLGYTVTPATVTWTPFIFDFVENPVSCGNRTIECFFTVGLNDDSAPNNTELFPVDDELLCAGTVTPEPAVETDSDTDSSEFGWARIFVSGFGDFDNHIGFFGEDNFSGASWMFTVKN